MPSWGELKDRKIVQWAFAYLAGAWLALEALDLLGETWGVPPTLVRIAHVVLAFGFLATLVLAWYHGEQGRQSASGPELLMLTGIFVVAGAALAVVGDDATGHALGPQAAAVVDVPEITPFTVPERSIAVLPFEDHSPNPDDAYLAGAMADAIAGALMKVPGLHVAQGTSTDRFERGEMTAGEFAAGHLGTAYVIDGSVQAHEERIRITVKLLDARSGALHWNRPYDVSRDTVRDVLDLQVDVAERVADELATTLTEQDVERMLSDWTDDPVAYELYLQAVNHDGRTLADYQARIPLLEQAIARDSGFVWAYFVLGDAYYQVASRQAGSRDGETPADDAGSREGQGWRLFDLALARAEDPVLRSNLRVFELLLERRADEAIDLSRSLVLENPTDAMSLEFLLTAYLAAGRVVEVAEVGRKLLALDPLNARRRYAAGSFYLGLGMDSLAEAHLRQAVRLGDERGWEGLLDVHLYRGDTAAAGALVDSMSAVGVESSNVAAFKERAWAGDADGARAALGAIDEQRLRDRLWEDAPLIAHVSFLAGDTARADEVLREAAAVADRSWLNKSWLPGTFAVRGDGPATAAAMREAMEAGTYKAAWLARDPVFSRVRAHPEVELALAEVAELIERQRRQIERQLAEEE